MTQQEFQQRYTYNPDTDRIGKGGFGCVYKAFDTVRKRYVAIKASQVDEHKFDLKREVELSHEIAPHENVAKYENCYRFNIAHGITFDYAVMEYYTEGSLSEVIKNHTLNEKEKRELITGILQGIAHLHNEGVIHRDLKSGNILVKHENGHWIPRITDFGLSRLTETDSSISNSSIGISYAFAAPEQIKGLKLRKNVDLWAAGTVIYHILTGKLPFTADGITDTNAANLEISRKITSHILPNDFQYLPQGYKAIIERCWVIDTEKRVQRAEEIFRLLQGVGEKETVSDPRRKFDMLYDEIHARYHYNHDNDLIRSDGYGNVYKAYDTKNKCYVTVRESYVGICHPDFQQHVATFTGKHPNVSKIKDYYRFNWSNDKSYNFTVMEYSENNMQKLLKNNTLTFEQKHRVLMQILEGIDFLHKNEIIHYELCPENILIEQRGNEFIPRIISYGFDKSLVELDPEALLPPMKTRMYNSPEQLTCKKIGKNTDLWSFGVIAFQMLTGQYPFTFYDESEDIWSMKLELHKEIVAGRMSKSLDAIPSSDWRMLIQQCLKTDPLQRIANARKAIHIVDGVKAAPTSDCTKNNKKFWDKLIQKFPQKGKVYILLAICATISSFVTFSSIWFEGAPEWLIYPGMAMFFAGLAWTLTSWDKPTTLGAFILTLLYILVYMLNPLLSLKFLY